MTKKKLSDADVIEAVHELAWALHPGSSIQVERVHSHGDGDSEVHDWIFHVLDQHGNETPDFWAERHFGATSAKLMTAYCRFYASLIEKAKARAALLRETVKAAETSGESS